MSPNLDDPKLFDRRPAVPILDVHRRGDRTVDEARLQLVVANSNRRARAGDPALIFLGHTRDGVPETDQPPLAGYARNYVLGRHQGRPCILADLFYSKQRPEAFAYPRRSVEVYYSDNDPAMNYIDAVALLKTSPERDLGLVAYSKGAQKERYSMATETTSAAGITEADIPALLDFMKRRSITDMAEGIKAFLKARSEGTADASPNEFTRADVLEMDKYCKRHGIDTTKPGAYEAALVRYKSARNAGELYRT